MTLLIVKHVAAEGPGIIVACLREKRIPYQVLNLELNKCFPKLDDLTHIILLGGPMNVYEEDRYPFLRQEDLFIKEAIQRGKRILGICLGAQLIAKALGARVYMAPAKEIGWFDLSLTAEGERDPLFAQFPKTFSVFQWHGDTFDLPHGAKLIATSSPVQNQAFRYGENAYGLQFHLEVTEQMTCEWMKEYAEEFEIGKSPHPSKEEILEETKRKWTEYSNQGIMFFSLFLEF